MDKIISVIGKVLYDYLIAIITGLIVLLIVGTELTPLKLLSNFILPVILSRYSGWIAFLILLVYMLTSKLKNKLRTKHVETMKLIPQHNRSHWSMGTLEAKPIMHLYGHFYVTNISRDNVFICGAKLRKPKIDGHILVRHVGQNIYGSYPIPPGHTTEAIVDFIVQSKIYKKSKQYVSNIDFIDQFGNSYRIRSVKFFPTPEVKEEPVGLPLETVSDIKNPIERNIVAILQAELERYKNCGRRVGGLGSIQTTYKGRTSRGVGTDWREPDSPKLQSVVPDPENATIESDNASTLIRFYHSLSPEQKDNFVEFLLKRLSREAIYASVGYFSLFVLFHTGHLSKALRTAKDKLQNDTTYGFSDFMRLLDGLLKYEYPKFTKTMIDNTEQFLKNIEEYTFRIQERVNAIRILSLGEISEHKSIN